MGHPKPIIRAAILFTLILLGSIQGPRARAGDPHIGYGFNVADPDVELLQEMGFNWIKVFGAPSVRWPVYVLFRVMYADASAMNNLEAFADTVYKDAANHRDNIDAYEVGNEVNLDVSYGWGAPPNAADYVTLLCTAYEAIKAADPQSIVVSAGLAPVGRVQGNWEGHPGHNGMVQDEREYLREFLDAGGGDCLDAVGYHPYGFSADYDAEPDFSPGNDPDQNCTNGFCFRGVEKIYDILVEHGLGHRQIWATEFGWLTPPPDHCLGNPDWQGRQWQIVSEQEQADNLAGAYQYADAHWPWMGPMTAFNLNFNYGPYPECEHMRYYAVQSRPAETALTTMPKSPALLVAELQTTPNTLSASYFTAQQPLTTTWTLTLGNSGNWPFTYTVTADPDLDLTPIITPTSGRISLASETEVSLHIPNVDRQAGFYEGIITIEASSDTIGAPVEIPLQLVVRETAATIYFPVIGKE